METENNTQTDNKDKFERFEKSFSRVQTFITPLAIIILFIFNFGYGMRDTQASTSQEIDDLKKGQAATANQMTNYRNERLTQFDEFKREVKGDFKNLRDELDKQGTIQREDLRRLDEKLDKILEMKLR